MSGSDAKTRGVRVRVESQYVADRSRPAENEWFFAYHVTISNEGARTVRLISRHWVICDASGRVHEVRGPGVVGEQPVLEPGESYEYTSACPLQTAFGTMHGTYQMVNDEGESFDVEIAPFALGEPFSIN